METVCNESPIKQQCDEFIEQFTPQIIKLLEEQLQPETLCGELALCISNKVKHFYKLFYNFICLIFYNVIEGICFLSIIHYQLIIILLVIGN